MHPKPSGTMIITNYCLHTKHMLHARTGTLLQVMYVKSIITWDRYKRKMCEKTRYTVKLRCNILLSEFLFGESWNLILLGRFRFSAGFAHLPKYYPPIIAVRHFTKVFFLQNFVSYSRTCFIYACMDATSYPAEIVFAWTDTNSSHCSL